MRRHRLLSLPSCTRSGVLLHAVRGEHADMHTADTLFRAFETVLQSKPLPVSGFHFVRLHCSGVECTQRAGMQPELRRCHDADPNGHRWTMHFDARDTHPKRNRDALRWGVRVLVDDGRFDRDDGPFARIAAYRDIPSEALRALILELEALMPGDGEYVPFAEHCEATPLALVQHESLALARELPLSVLAAVIPIRPEHPSERSLERYIRVLAEADRELRAELRQEVWRYSQKL